MSTSPTSLERKVRQLDNDVQSIYEMLSAIQGTQLRHGNRLDELDEKLTSLEAKVDGVDTKVGGLEAKVDRVDTKADGLRSDLQTVLELLRAR